MRASAKLLALTFASLLSLDLSILGDALADMPGILHARQLAITAVVEEIDYAARTATLRGPGGNTLQIEADASVVNFAQVKKGDQIQVNYLEAVAIQVMKPEDVGAAGEATTLQVAPLGDKPGLVSSRTEQDSVVVQSIDYEARLATLQMADGALVTVEVDPSVKNLASVKPGDHIVVRRTEAIAISVRE